MVYTLANIISLKRYIPGAWMLSKWPPFTVDRRGSPTIPLRPKWSRVAGLQPLTSLLLYAGPILVQISASERCVFLPWCVSTSRLVIRFLEMCPAVFVRFQCRLRVGGSRWNCMISGRILLFWIGWPRWVGCFSQVFWNILKLNSLLITGTSGRRDGRTSRRR